MVGGEKGACAALRADLHDAGPEGRLRGTWAVRRQAYVKWCTMDRVWTLQAYAEGYEILHASRDSRMSNLHQILGGLAARSVVRSWLNELAVRRSRTISR